MSDDFIRKELEYFKPMSSRQKNATNEMRLAWQKETVRERTERISLETYEMCAGTVIYGPFKGLKLNKETWWGKSDLGSQCLGLYEKEVLNFIQRSKITFDTFVDIGAGDGYYATGMLVAGFVKKSVCFEISKIGRKKILENWKGNNSIGSIDIFGEATKKKIIDLPIEKLGKTLILIDIEGNEFELLSRKVLSCLKNSFLIIEIHNWVEGFESKYSKLLEDIFCYFNVKVLEQVERETFKLNELRSYTDDNRLLLTSEQRPCRMRFLTLTPKL